MSEPIFEVDQYVGYEWAACEVYPHPLRPGTYAFFSDSGCSCDSYEAPTLGQLHAATPLGRGEVRTALINFLDMSGSYFSPGEAIRHLERFQEAMSGE
jgi:hypothetical protein